MLFSVLDQITHKYASLTSVDKRIADVIIEQPEQIVDLPVKQIAERTLTSEAAVVRFSKKIGMSGIKALKLELARELHAVQSEKVSRKIELTDSPDIVMHKVFNNSIRSLYHSERVLDIEAVERAAEHIMSAPRLMIVGMGGSSVVAHDLKIKLRRIDLYADYILDSHSAMTGLANFTHGDAAFFISTSGRTKEIVELMRFGKERGVTLILLTQNVNSPARRLSDIVLLMSEEENNIKLATMTARIAQLVIIDILFMTICTMQGEESMRRIITIHDALRNSQVEEK